jgi:23S rRNA (cytosine1962-C5)-methyltransferase
MADEQTDGMLLQVLLLSRCSGRSPGRNRRPYNRSSMPRAITTPPRTASPREVQLPAVKIDRRAVQRLRAGHVWVYRSDLIDQTTPRAALVRVVDEAGRSYGCALSSSTSQIALRMLDTRELAPERMPHVVAERVRAAIAYRRQLAIPERTDAYRVVFSEADSLPGLVIDRYNDVIAVQFLTQAMDLPEAREAVVKTLQDELAPAGIVERVEARIRELEDLAARDEGLLAGSKLATHFEMNRQLSGGPVRFAYDASLGQKTGAFLDQRENYAAAAQYARGAALDVFCYQGGFALHLARVCEQVIGVDASRAALEVGERNFALNRETLRPAEIEWMEANAFDLLRDWSDAGRKFSTIVLDPPAFAKTKRTLPTALRGYKELNLRALKMLEPGGVLITCSCSHHVSEQEFIDMVSEAARDAHRRVRVLERRGQALDHPVISGIPETAYLKCLILYAE